MALQTAGPGPEPSNTERDGEKTEDSVWLTRARDAYETSTDYFESSIRKKIERSVAHFQNRHAPGSKYYTEPYKFRAKGFRPKTRTVVRKGEAEVAAAYFSTDDLVHIKTTREDSPVHRVSAEINNELLNYRLQKTIPWFMTLVGAYQDAQVQGVCISHQHWDYRERSDSEPMDADEEGQFLTQEGEQAEQESITVLSDKPSIELRPIENIRFSPSANWIDPMGTSPYIVDRIPMDAGDVKARMKDNGTGRPVWHELDASQMAVGRDGDGDQGVRAQREAGREDSKDQKHAVSDFDTVWVHRNIIRHEQRDYLFYTLGTWYLLSDPVPLMDEYRHLREGERPYTMGYATIETHKTHPDSLADMTAPLQQEANDINNQRRDNVALVMQRRYFARRGAKINYRQLQRSVPGGVTEMDDITQDIRSEAPPEVTQSAYAEQDRVNMDYDELAGNFSTSSVSSNRNLNETVGGMNMLGGEANKIGEYQLRLFNETWVEKTLSQVVRMEQAYETDPAIFEMLGEKVKVWKRFGLNRVTDLMIQGEMDVTINVGVGATNPDKRLQRVLMTMQTLAKTAPKLMEKLDEREVAAEIFGSMGHKSIDRFLPEEDENAEEKPPPQDPRVTLELKKLEQQGKIEQMKLQSAAEERQLKMAEMQYSHQIAMMKLSADKDMGLDKIKAELGGIAIKERGANERFYSEKQLALATGSGI